MRLFQLMPLGDAYLQYFSTKHGWPSSADSEQIRQHLLSDRFLSSHILEPIDQRKEWAFISVPDDMHSQRTWAKEKGMPVSASTEEIVLAQIEDHRTEVFYNHGPITYDSKFIRRLPGTVKASLCWIASPIKGADLSSHDRCLCNFQGLLEQWQKLGLKTAWFEPAHDPAASEYVKGRDRQVDIAFAGGYSRHHVKRNDLLKRISKLGDRYDVRFHFLLGKAARIVNHNFLFRRAFSDLAIDSDLRKVTRPPVFGRSLYELFGNAKIVINAAIDMASQYRGNMRCWEAMGCGALMLSDAGIYPEGMTAGRDFETYVDADDAIMKIEMILADYGGWFAMAESGRKNIENCYTKEHQWRAFEKLVESI
ncbi:glycosyltransferase [Herbaspirillum lusitanum]|uniref:Glycosyltransferase n=1 Tax=Herbaspirillum lusitanum TaxID=213312 RepID=A0ABW9A884_9BURK